MFPVSEEMGKAAAVRAVKTVAQDRRRTIGTAALGDVNWPPAVAAPPPSGPVLSLLTSVAGLPGSEGVSCL